MFEALGRATVCWDPRPAGVFDSRRCQQIGEELLVELGLDKNEPL